MPYRRSRRKRAEDADTAGCFWQLTVPQVAPRGEEHGVDAGYLIAAFAAVDAAAGDGAAGVGPELVVCIAKGSHEVIWRRYESGTFHNS